MSDHQETVQDLGSMHTYRTEIPNIIYEIGLKGNEIAVYNVLKRTAGDRNNCTKSTKRLAKEAGISEKTFRLIKKKFQLVNPCLKKALIKVVRRKTECGDPDTDIIQIIDIWPQNMSHFMNKANRGTGNFASRGGSKTATRGTGKTAGLRTNLDEEDPSLGKTSGDCGNVHNPKVSSDQGSFERVDEHSRQSSSSFIPPKRERSSASPSSSCFDDQLEAIKQFRFLKGNVPVKDKSLMRWLGIYDTTSIYGALSFTRKMEYKNKGTDKEIGKPEAYAERSLQEGTWQIEREREVIREREAR